MTSQQKGQTLNTTSQQKGQTHVQSRRSNIHSDVNIRLNENKHKSCAKFALRKKINAAFYLEQHHPGTTNRSVNIKSIICDTLNFDLVSFKYDFNVLLQLLVNVGGWG